MIDPNASAIKIFSDGADIDQIKSLAANAWVRGFTTNPTLMRKAGVIDYEAFAREVLTIVPEAPVSFEVFSDDFDDMDRQARKIAAWGRNVYVKIPVTNTRAESSRELIRRLSDRGVRLNVTAILSLAQVEEVVASLEGTVGAIVSVFAGRIADTGRDPVPLMTEALGIVRSNSALELLWASPREVLNIVQAESIGCDIITVTSELLAKLSGLGRDLEKLSLDTVKMFFDDAQSAGYSL